MCPCVGAGVNPLPSKIWLKIAIHASRQRRLLLRTRGALLDKHASALQPYLFGSSRTGDEKNWPLTTSANAYRGMPLT